MDCGSVLSIELGEEKLDRCHQVNILGQVLGLLRGQILHRWFMGVPFHLSYDLPGQVSRLLGQVTECSHDNELGPP